jgi:charged multivesicular body protein 4
MNFFGRKSKKAAAPAPSASISSTPTTTIVKLRETIQQQEKRQTHIQSKIDTLVAEAKAKMASNDKKGALFAMKRKKMYESEIEKIDATKMTLEQQCINLESATQNKETFAALKTGTQAMKNIRKEMDIEKVDDMMDDIREEMELAQEISNAIAQPVDIGTPMDDDELMAELAELEMQDTEQKLLKKPATATADTNLGMPTVPTGKLAAPKNQTSAEMEEEAALKELEALMA